MQTRPFGVGEVLVAGDLARIDPVLGVHDAARALAEPEPLAFRMAQLGRNGPLQHLRGYRLQDARLIGAPQPAGVDRDQHVGRAVAALGLDALEQLVGVALDQIDHNAGLLGERVVQRHVRIIMPR